jgi:hypothetical protein
MTAPPDLVVVQRVKEWTCAECGGTGDLPSWPGESARRRRERDRERRADTDAGLQAAIVQEIARLFPGCPAERAEAIAWHTSQRGSGRVGRSAAGRSLDEKAITLAVVASVRHEDTAYDELLMSGVARDDAREQIKDTIALILRTWA